jgi:hypothetical protein
MVDIVVASRLSDCVSPTFAGERQKGDMACAFNLAGQLPLVGGAGACLTSWADLSIFSYESAEHIDLFVIDAQVLVCTKLADLWTSYEPAGSTVTLLVFV